MADGFWNRVFSPTSWANSCTILMRLDGMGGDGILIGNFFKLHVLHSCTYHSYLLGCHKNWNWIIIVPLTNAFQSHFSPISLDFPKTRGICRHQRFMLFYFYTLQAASSQPSEQGCSLLRNRMTGSSRNKKLENSMP